METARSIINAHVFESIEFYSSYIFQNGENAEYLGVKLLDEPEKFVKGALINCAARLFLHYNATADKRDAEAWERLIFSIRLLKDDTLKTWGKLNALRGAYALQKEGFLSSLPDDCLELLIKNTKYDDFYDAKRTVLLGNYPSNYYQVAMACAGLREMLGWENYGESNVIREKLLSIMSNYSSGGWMDEQPPYGRFDRYSIIVSSELIDTLDLIEKEIPDFALQSLKNAAELAVSCANPHGDGIIYGRSLSVHGDCAYLEIIASALRHGVIAPSDIKLATLYCGSILRHTFDFWYDAERNTYDLWFNGRTTNKYRQVKRLLEVNLDMAIHMLNTLDNLDAAGYADEPIDEEFPRSSHSFSRPVKTIFKSIQNEERVLYSFVRNGALYQLPLIGAGKLSLNAAYLPFPTTPVLLEAPPETHCPFLVPYFTSEANYSLIPAGFYTETGERKINENGISGIEITAKGYMGRFSDENADVDQSDIQFTTIYTLVDDRIRIKYKAETDDKLLCKCVYASSENGCKISFNGVTPDPIDVSNEAEYFTPHGKSKYLYEYSANTNDLEISIILP